MRPSRGVKVPTNYFSGHSFLEIRGTRFGNFVALDLRIERTRIRNRREKRCRARRRGEREMGNPRQGHMPVRKVALLEDDDPSTPAGFRPTPLVRAPLTTSRLSPLVLLLHRKVFHYLPSSSYFSSTSSFPHFVFKERINNCPDYGSGFDRVRSWRVWKNRVLQIYRWRSRDIYFLESFDFKF